MNTQEKEVRDSLEDKTRDSLQANAENKSYSITAGAGAGKTTLLSRRIASQIRKGIEPEEFLIITYTNAAAAELQRAIVERLQEYKETNEKAREALGRIESMQISTIHSFLLNILKENAFEAGISLDVQKLEEEEDQKRKEAFFDEWYKKHYSEIRKKFKNDWVITSKEGRKYDKTREVLENLFYDLADVRDEIYPGPEDLEAADEKVKKVKRAVEYVVQDIQDKQKDEQGIQKNEPSIQKAYQDEIDQNTRTLSDSDILHRSEQMLKKHRDILDRLRTRYSRIYVDEFQDTTSLQTRIIWMLSQKKGEDPGDRSLETLSKGKLVIVGDPKQSIYRFTGAEKAVFEDLHKKFAEGPEETEGIDLYKNHRSCKKIVDWVNTCFERLGLIENKQSYMTSDWESPDDESVIQGVFGYQVEPENEEETDLDRVVSLIRQLTSNELLKVEDPKSKGTFRQICYSDIMIILRNTTNLSKYVSRLRQEGIPVSIHGKHDIQGDEVLRRFISLVSYFGHEKNKHYLIAAQQVCSGYDVTGTSEHDFYSGINQLKSIGKELRNMSPAGMIYYLMQQEELFLPKCFEKNGTQYSVSEVQSYRMNLHQMVSFCLMRNPEDLTELVSLMEDYLDRKIKIDLPLEQEKNMVRIMNVHQAKGLTGQIVIIADRRNEEKCRFSGFRSEGKYYPSVSYIPGDNRYRSAKSSQNKYRKEYYPVYETDRELKKRAETEESEESIRLQYVAATRAAQALIILPVCNNKDNIWFSREEYGYANLPDINQRIKDITEHYSDEKRQDQCVNDSMKDPKPKMIRLYDKNNRLSSDPDIQKTEISLTPSSLERNFQAGNTTSSKDRKESNKPGNSIYGIVFHRIMELMINWMKVKQLPADDQIQQFVQQALMEQLEYLSEDDYIKYKDDLLTTIDSYSKKFLDEVLKDAVEVYPEYHFSFYVPDDERPDFMNEFEQVLKEKKINLPDDKQGIWINGQADLVVKCVKQGKTIIRVYDYKTDEPYGMDRSKFQSQLKKKYRGQLKMYRYAMKKMFQMPVETMLFLTTDGTTLSVES